MSDPANVYEVTDPAQLDRPVCYVLTLAAHNVVAINRPLLDPMGPTHPRLPARALGALLRARPGRRSSGPAPT